MESNVEYGILKTNQNRSKSLQNALFQNN